MIFPFYLFSYLVFKEVFAIVQFKLLKLKLWRDFMDSIFNWTLFVRFFCNFVFIFLTGLIGVPETKNDDRSCFLNKNVEIAKVPLQ